MTKKVVVLLCVLSFVYMCAARAEEAAIGGLFKDKAKNGVPVKVFIKDVINQSGQSQVEPEAFKKVFEQSLLKRKSIKFQVVNSAAESDVQVSAAIKTYRYMDRGPLKLSPSLSTIALDAIASATENYVDMGVEYTVIDTVTGKLLWHDIVSNYIKKKMTPEESRPLIYDAVTREFIWKCFGRARPER